MDEKELLRAIIAGFYGAMKVNGIASSEKLGGMLPAQHAEDGLLFAEKIMASIKWEE